MKKKINYKNSNIFKIILPIFIVLIICLCIFLNRDIKKVLGLKYDTVKCIDSSCNNIMAVKEEKNKETITLLDSSMKKIAKYTAKKDDKLSISKVSKNYFIQTKEKNDIVTKYIVNDMKANKLYKTENKLDILNDNYILEIKDNEKYSIIDKNGKEVYSDLKLVTKYADGKYISVKLNDNYILFDSEFNKILDGYSVDKEVVTDDGDTLYLVLKDESSNKYNYFSVKKDKIVGDSFDSYTKTENDYELIITKKINNSKKSYILYKNGKQKKQEDGKSQTTLVNNIKSNLDSKYYLYTSTVISQNQKYVLVDNLSDKSIGTYNLKTKEYKEMYKYSKEDNFYSSVIKINSKSNNYYQISCFEGMCSSEITLVYDLNSGKEVYKNESNDKLMQNYIQYENDYKIIKFFKTSTNTDYKGKYVLYDKNNKELLKSDNEILIIGSNIIIGNEIENNSSLALYSLKDNKVLTTTSGEVIKINNKTFYKYTESDNKVVLIDNNGSKVLESKDNGMLTYSDDAILTGKNKLELYDINTKKTINYSLKKNEKITDVSLDEIKPYKGYIYVTNEKKEYIKLVNNSGKIKQIKNARISSVALNDENKVMIIVKNNSNKFGLYVIK